MSKRRRAVLLCGTARATLAVIARELACPEAALLIQAAAADVAGAQRLCRAIARSGGAAQVVRGELGGDAQSRTLVAQAWKAARAIDMVVICPDLAAAGGAQEPALAQWDAAIAAQLRGPFFLAKHAGPRLARAGGGRLVFAIGAPPRRRAPVATVVREGLIAMVDGLSRALPRAVAVTAVLGDERGAARSSTAQLARGVRCFVAAEWPLRGAFLELGTPARRG